MEGSWWVPSVTGTVAAMLLAAATAVWAPYLPTALATGTTPAPGPISEETEPETVRLVLTEYSLDPATSAVQAGAARMLLENGGFRRHNVVVLVDGTEHASPYLRPGESVIWDVQIERPGTYRFWCSEYRHLEKGMEGTLTVE